MRLIWPIALLSYAILLTALHYSMASPWWLASPERMADFTAVAPFQYRLLLPAMVAALRVTSPLGVELLFALTEVVAWMLLIVVAHRALVVFRIGTSDLLRRALAMTVVIPVAIHLIMPDLRMHSAFVINSGVLELGEWRVEGLFRYVYDLPAAVLTLALVLLLRRFVQTLEGLWFAAYLGLFAFATLNRETTWFMLPAFFAVCYRVLDWGTLAKTLMLQIAVFVAIHGSMQWFFMNNANPYANIPGTQYENHLIANLTELTNPLYLITYLARFGAGLYLPILLLHRSLEPVLSRTLLCFGIPFLASTLLFGRIQEHRVFIEIVPLLWLGAVQALAARNAVHAPPTAAPRSKEVPKESTAVFRRVPLDC